MDDELIHRIGRIHAAIGVLEDFDLQSLKAKVTKTEESITFVQDFRGGLTDEELSNAAYSAIHNIANLHGHLRAWAARNGHEKTRVDEACAGSLPLQIIQDLSNNDKHGYPPRDGGLSGKSPKLVNVDRVLHFSVGPKGFTAVTLGIDGIPVTTGSGSSAPRALITGDIVDAEDVKIGDLHQFVSDAVETWEKLLQQLGVVGLE